MARKSRTGVLKRQREAKKAERAALKRERQGQGQSEHGEASDGARVATSEDLAGYGFANDRNDEEGDSQPPTELRHPRGGHGSPPPERQAWPKSP